MDSKYFKMISEDRSAVANLPQEVVQKQFPECAYINYNLDDTMGQLDQDRKADISEMKRNKSKSKY